MGNKSANDIKALIEADKTFKAKLDAIGVKVDEFIAASDETKKANWNELYEEFKKKNQGESPTPVVVEPPVVVTPPTPTPTPEVPPVTTTTTGLLYDSNVDGKWNNNVARTVSGGKDGDTGPNGKGLYTAASGSPKFIIDGNGVGTLETQPGFGRIYIAACNYNATLEYEFNIQSGSVDNLSEKCRSRHQMGDPPEHRFGGLGSHVALSGEVGFKVEKYHNVQLNGSKGTLPKKLALNTWYKSKYEYKDSADQKAIEFIRWIDFSDGAGFVKVLEGKETAIEPYFIDKASFDKQSEFWLRLNGSGKISFKNVKLRAI